MVKQYLNRPKGFQQFEAHSFRDGRQRKVVRWSTLRTGRLYPPRKYSWYSYLLEAESTPGQSAAGRIMSNDNNRNRIRDLPSCSAVPQTSAPLRNLCSVSIPAFLKSVNCLNCPTVCSFCLKYITKINSILYDIITTSVCYSVFTYVYSCLYFIL